MGMDVDKPFQLEIAVEHSCRSQAKKLEPIAEFDAFLTGRARLSSSSSLLWNLAVILAHSGDPGYGYRRRAGLVVWPPFWHRSAAILGISIVIRLIRVRFERAHPQTPAEGNWGGIYRSTTHIHSLPGMLHAPSSSP